MSQASQLDVLSIGDVVVDAFIKLFDNQAHTYTNEHGKWIAMPFGTKIPFDFTEVIPAVGNAANAAVAFSRLGLKTGFISNVGEDKYGRETIRALNKQHIDTRFVHVNIDKITNYHYVLWYKDERTILIKHEEYDYEWPRFRKADVPRWIYLSSISERAIDYHDEIVEWMDDNPSVKLAFQPGTFQMKAGTERLREIYKRTDVVVLNREEAVFVSGGDYHNMHDLFDRLHKIGPKTVVITDGPAGAYASDGTNRYSMPLYPDPAPPYERTGAGDSFASTFVAAIMSGNTLEGALQWAPINSMSVVQQAGAQKGLLSEKDLSDWLTKAPEWYKPTRM